MGMDISFIIVHYNAVALLHNCVRSILEHTQGVQYEIIVVDNASSDRSIEQFPNAFENAPIQLVLLKQNKGFGAGNNAAYKVAKGKYLFLLNPDTLLCSNAAMQFYTFMEQQEERQIAACGADLIDVSGNSIQAFGNFPTYLSAIAECGPKFLFLSYFKKHMALGGANYSKEIKLVDYLSGAALFIRKKVIDQLGFFDEAFFLYFEETELAYRLQKNGYRMALLPEVKIIHLEGQVVSNNFQGLQKFTWSEQSRQLFYKKTRGAFFAATMKCLDISQLIIRTLSGKEQGPLLPKIAIIWKA